MHSEMFVTPADFETVCSAFSTDLVNRDKHQLPPAELRAGKADLSAPELFREGDTFTLTLNSSLGSVPLQISRQKVRREPSSQADKIITIYSDIPLNYVASP